MNGILQSTMFLAPIEVYAQYLQSEQLTIENCESYQKRSYRNRSYLSGPNGLSLLSIPLEKGKNSGTQISEVKIAYHDNWVGNVLHSIRTCLGSSPFFDFYYDDLADIFKSRPEKLVDLNQELLQFICGHLQIDVKINLTTVYQKEEVEMDFRKYMEKPFPSPLNYYTQVFEDRHGYIHNLSILDLLFCTGPESRSILHALINKSK